ncbi:penicillin-binding protein 1C [Microvirga tunisiensis]|uniref:peptidoglycan glycosyltransferase n=1 Tax=Pannonibacter tanglangensis TaxID=2750084 RepID=A0A7X5J856_9HYPH|nr:penicillin-binding protein 1C [Pannonibacter sp. XCT-53]
MRRIAGLAAGVALLALAAGGALYHQVATAPLPPRLADISVSRVVLDRNGDLLRAFATRDERWRLPVRLDEIDPLYIRMLMAFEDRRFRAHHGVDPLALGRAALQTLSRQRIVSGGSTLTMQVVRLLNEAPTRSLAAKWQQMIGALALEQRLGKDDILSLYVMRAPFGGNLEGVRAASLVWFGKEPRRLTPAEAALLVALPQAPEARRPDRFPEAARRARDRVLDRAVEAGVLSVEDAQAARLDPVPVVRRAMPMIAPHLTSLVAAANPAAVSQTLTLDRDLQRAMEQLVAAKALQLGPQMSAALLVADHGTGEILASVGSPGLADDGRQGYVDMTGAVRSPGSALKPLIYGLAFEQGVAHPESFIEDRPVRIAGYDPTNFDLSFQGTVTVREALQLSLNIPAVKLLEAVGPAQLTARLRRTGITPVLPEGLTPGLAIGLGGVGLTLRDLTTLYASIAAGGRPLRLVHMAGESARLTPALPVLEPVPAWYVADILARAPRPSTAADAGIAFKTGTAYGYRDAVAVGFDGRHVVGVWTGRADGTPVPGMTGLTSAAPILFEAFDRLGPSRVPLPAAPGGVLSLATAGLPQPLRRARVRTESPLSGGVTGTLRISHPPSGAEVDLGLGLSRDTSASPLVVKLQGGTGPFTWFANGAPVASGAFQTQLVWRPDGPGLQTIMVIDGRGATDRIEVTIR